MMQLKPCSPSAGQERPLKATLVLVRVLDQAVSRTRDENER